MKFFIPALPSTIKELESFLLNCWMRHQFQERDPHWMRSGFLRHGLHGTILRLVMLIMVFTGHSLAEFQRKQWENLIQSQIFALGIPKSIGFELLSLVRKFQNWSSRWYGVQSRSQMTRTRHASSGKKGIWQRIVRNQKCSHCGKKGHLAKDGWKSIKGKAKAQPSKARGMWNGWRQRQKES